MGDDGGESDDVSRGWRSGDPSSVSADSVCNLCTRSSEMSRCFEMSLSFMLQPSCRWDGDGTGEKEDDEENLRYLGKRFWSFGSSSSSSSCKSLPLMGVGMVIIGDICDVIDP